MALASNELAANVNESCARNRHFPHEAGEKPNGRGRGAFVSESPRTARSASAPCSGNVRNGCVVTKIREHLVASLLYAGVGVFGAATMVAVAAIGSAPASAQTSTSIAVGPSYNCRAPAVQKQPLAQLICASPAVSKAELNYVIAYSALRQTSADAGRATMRAEAEAFTQRTTAECGIPAAGYLGGRAPTPEETRCLLDRFDWERNRLFRSLSGDAMEEAQLSPDQTIAIQRALKEKGFLPASEALDGVFGPVTRSAMAEWQRSNGLPATGLGSSAMLAQLEHPSATALTSPSGRPRIQERAPQVAPGSGLPPAAKSFGAIAPLETPPIAVDPTTAWIVGGIIVVVLWYILARRAKARAREEFLTKIKRICFDHADALGRRYRQLVKEDAYGRTELAPWQEETLYFARTQIWPTLDARQQKLFGEEAMEVTKIIVATAMAARDQLADKATEAEISKMPGHEYEQHCADLLRKGGWEVKVTKGSGDFGIDLIAEMTLGARSRRRSPMQTLLGAHWAIGGSRSNGRQGVRQSRYGHRCIQSTLYIGG